MTSAGSDVAPVAFSDVSKRYGRKQVLDGFDLHVEEGQVYGLLGRNGTGKTTALTMLMGLHRPTRGRATLYGHDPYDVPADVKQGIAFVAENQRMFPRMTVRQTVQFTRAFFVSWDDDYAERLLDYFDLDPGARVATLSQGQNTRLALLLALAPHPRLLILDDPTLGLDPVARHELVRQLVDLMRRDRPATILISSHQLGDVERIATHVGILRDGRLLLDEPLDVLKDKTKTLRFVFPDGAPEGFAVPGALRSSHNERQCLVTTGAYDPEAMAALAARYGLAPPEVLDLNLEEIYVHLVGGHGPRD